MREYRVPTWLLARVALSVVSIGIGLVLFELGSMYLLQSVARGLDGWSLVGPSTLSVRPSEYPEINYLLEPNTSFELSGISISINGDGLRGPEISPVKESGAIRILCLGDSVVFGWAVRQEDAFCNQLPLHLCETCANRIEVVNAGVPGWDQPTEAAYLEYYGRKFDPDIVIGTVTASNDVTVLPASIPSRSFKVLIRDNSHTLRAVRLLQCCSRVILENIFSVSRTSQESQRQPDMSSPRRPPGVREVDRSVGASVAPFPNERDDPLWEPRIRDPLFKMNALARSHGAIFMVVIVPTIDQVEDQRSSTTLQQIIQGVGDVASFPVVDVLDAFRSRHQDLRTQPLRPRTRPLFADEFHHPNSEGHRVIAQRISAALQEGPVLANVAQPAK